MARSVVLLGLVLVLLAPLSPGRARGQMVLDGSLGPPGGELTGPDYRIDASDGVLVGTNLFHSFLEFNVGAGESANFTADGLAAGDIANVLSRVTGANPSTIHGLIRTTEIPGQADLYLMNPNGIVFGPDAFLDINGSFHASTGDFIEFGEGGPRFHADPSLPSVLSAAAPTDFGFLNGPAGTITVRSGADLEVRPAAALRLVAGQIDVEEGAILRAPVGFLVLQAQEVRVGVDVGSDEPTRIEAFGVDDAPGGTIALVAFGGRVSLGQESIVSASSDQAGGGQILVFAGDLALLDEARLSADGGPGSLGGSARIQADTVRLADRSTITVVGAEGRVEVLANEVELTGTSRLAVEAPEGDGGVIRIAGPGDGPEAIAGSLVIQGEETADPDAIGPGLFVVSRGRTGGRVEVDAGKVVVQDSGFIASLNQVEQPSDSRVQVQAGTIEVTSAIIATDTNGEGPGADLSLLASEARRRPQDDGGIHLVLAELRGAVEGAGDGGSVTIETDGVLQARGAVIESGQVGGGSGTPGAIRMVGQDVLLSGTTIRTATAGGQGGAGAVVVQAQDSLVVTRGSVFEASSGGAGAGGDITLESAGRVDVGLLEPGGDPLAGFPALPGEVDAGVEINAFSLGSGDGGDVRLEAADTLRVRGVDPDRLTRIRTSTLGEAPAGEIRLLGEEVGLQHVELQSNTAESGAGGGLFVAGREVSIADSEISAIVAKSGRGGAITIEGDALVEVLGTSLTSGTAAGATGAAGSIDIRGRAAPPPGAGASSATLERVVLDGSKLETTTQGTQDAGNVEIRAVAVEIRNISEINANSFAGGDAGDVRIEADDSLRVLGKGVRGLGGLREGDTSIGSNVTGDGDGGTIELIAGRSLVIDNAAVASNTQGVGSGGEILLSADQVIGNLAFVAGAQDQGGTGSPGDIRIEAGDVLFQESIVNTSLLAGGDGGDVDVEATRLVRFRGGRSPVSLDDVFRGVRGSGILAASLGDGDGQGGDVNVTAPVIALEGRSMIASTTLSSGDAGNIDLTAARTLELRDGAFVDSSTVGAGNAGSVSVDAGRVAILGGARDGAPSRIGSVTAGQGASGLVEVRGGTVEVSGGAIATSSLGAGTTGRAGAIDVDAGTVRVARGGRIDSSTVAEGAGGSVEVRGRRLVEVTGRGSGIFAQTGSSGEGGAIAVSGQTVRVADGGTISAESGAGVDPGAEVFPDLAGLVGGGVALGKPRADGGGVAGSVRIDAGNLLVDGASVTATSQASTGGDVVANVAERIRLERASISAEAAGGAGGSIALRAGENIDIIDSEVTASVTSGSGGNIELDAPFILIDPSQVVAQATQGSGGNILITAKALIVSADSLISASSDVGIDGEVEINAPDADLVGAVTPLPADFLEATELLRERCAARTDGGTHGRFTVQGRDGIPPGPGSLLPASFAQPVAAQGHVAPAAPALGLAWNFGGCGA